MLTESITFAPFVFVGSVLVDLFVAGVQRNVYVTVTTELLLTIIYVSLALFVKKQLRFGIRQLRLADAVVLLVLIPVVATFSSCLYCTALSILCGAFPSDKLFVVMRHFWLGDTLGMVTIVPAVIPVIIILSMLNVLVIVYRGRIRRRNDLFIDYQVSSCIAYYVISKHDAQVSFYGSHI